MDQNSFCHEKQWLAEVFEFDCQPYQIRPLGESVSAFKSIMSLLIGVLILASLVGWTVSDTIEDIPKPSDGICAVTSEPVSIPSSGALVDVDLDLTWSDSSVWIGIINVETYAGLEKSTAYNGAEVVACNSQISYVAGGPGTGDALAWQPDGQAIHILVGGPEDTQEEDEEDDGFPPPFSPLEAQQGQDYSGDFDLTYEAHISGGSGFLFVLVAIEIAFVGWMLKR